MTHRDRDPEGAFPAPPRRTAKLGSSLRDVLVAFVPIQTAFLWLYYLPRERALMGDELRYRDEGWALATGGGYDPTFVWPPLQTWLLALSFGLFGQTFIPVQILQIALLFGGGLLLRAIARRLGLSEGASDMSLLLYVCYPELVAFSHYLWPEVSHLFLALLSVYLLLDRRAWSPAAAGLSLGAALLLKSLLLPMVPVFAAVAVLRAEPPRRRVAAALFLAGLCAATAPVVAFNGFEYGYWGIANSGPVNAWVGLNDQSPRNLRHEIVDPEMQAYLASGPDARARERLYRGKVRERVARDGWLETLERQAPRQLFRLFDKDSFFTDQLPGGAHPGYTTPSRTIVWQLRLASYVSYAALLVTSTLGLFVPLGPAMRWRMTPFLLFMGANVAMFLILHVKTRYRLPLVPVQILYAGILWDHMAGKLEPAEPRRWRTVAAVGTLLFVLFLAFSPK